MSGLLGPARIRELAQQVGLRPTKSLGQNFVHDANTVRRIVATAKLLPGETVLEVGPGLGSLTLGLLDQGHRVVAVEIDPALAQLLPTTVAELQPEALERLVVINEDALRITGVPHEPTALVANLPYNVAVPVLLHLLERIDTLRTVLVMVQAEVAQRLAAAPGSRVYGAPSVKAAWYGEVALVMTVSKRIFWPEPRVDSALVRLVKHPTPRTGISRDKLFAVVDAAFGQRRKMLRSALAPLFGSPAAVDEALHAAGVDPQARGESLDVEDFLAIANELT